jgi:hypothetical protein
VPTAAGAFLKDGTLKVLRSLTDQLLTAFLLARFFEWIAQKKKLLGASAERFATSHRTLAEVETPALSASMNHFSAFAVTTKACQHLVVRAFVTRPSLAWLQLLARIFHFRARCGL